MKLLNVSRWTKVRARGLRRFILVDGVLGFGLFMGLWALGTIWVFTTFSSLGPEIPGSQVWPRAVAFAAAAIFVVGPGWAIGTWFLNESLYRRIAGNPASAAPDPEVPVRSHIARRVLLVPLCAAAVLAPLAWNWNRTTNCVDWPKRLAGAEAELTKLEASSQRRFFILGDAAKSAAEVGEMTKAKEYALELLDLAPCFQTNWNYGNALHDGHMVLGRVAVASGNIEGAKQELLEAGRTPGSPQLDSFGPNMALALDLLRKGERPAVRQYFAECSTFWKLGRRRLESWTSLTKLGITPDFGANLLF
jgi:hypothetical protein